MSVYVVYRCGWNEANQKPEHGLPDRMAVARVEADSAEQACRIAAERVSLAANQRLSAEPAAEVDARENNLNLKAEALHNLQEPPPG